MGLPNVVGLHQVNYGSILHPQSVEFWFIRSQRNLVPVRPLARVDIVIIARAARISWLQVVYGRACECVNAPRRSSFSDRRVCSALLRLFVHSLP